MSDTTIADALDAVRDFQAGVTSFVTRATDVMVTLRRDIVATNDRVDRLEREVAEMRDLGRVRLLERRMANLEQDLTSVKRAMP